jgi:hypothetical protein
MQLKNLGLFALLLATLLAAGCRSSPIYNVTDAPITATDQAPTGEEIAQAIVRAGHSLGWIMKQQEPGLIVGTLNIRSHTAVVDINYDRTNYSITYKDSTNLGYTGTNIHTNYNGWIQNLKNAIDFQIGSL